MPDGFSFAEALQPAQPKGFSFAEASAPPAPDPLADSEGHLIDNPDEALKRGGALVQSTWARLSGTDRPPADTGDAVDTVDTRDTIAPGLRSALAPAANTTYGSILPFARDQGTGDVRLALPSSLRDLATGGLDLLEGPTTGTVTPAATSLLANAAIGGGLTPSLVRGTGAAIRDTAELGAPAADLYRPRITATEVQARDGVGIMEAWNRAHAENNAAAIDKIGQATDINEAIAAFGKAAEAPSGAAPDLLGGTVSALEAAQAPTASDLLAPTPVDGATSATGGTAVDATGAALSLIPKTSAEAKAVASAYYQRADQVGGTLLPEFTNKFIDKAESIAPQTPEGRAIAGDTAITGLVERIQALRDEPISLQGAQEIDERLGDLIDKEFGLKGLSKEGHELLDLQTTFRNMILDAGPADAANGIEGFEAIKQGRLAWAQAMKMMDFERILNRAELTDNPVTSIRTGIRTLLSNPARVRGYSPEEIAALKDAANRGVIGSVLHVFGSRLTPIAVGAAGLSTGVIPGLIGAGVTHGLTSMMRSGATSLQMGRANRAMSVLGGGVPPPLP